MPVTIFANVHHSKFGAITTKEKPRQNSLVFRNAGFDFVLLEGEFRRRRHHCRSNHFVRSTRTTRQEYAKNQYGEQAASIMSCALGCGKKAFVRWVSLFHFILLFGFFIY